MNREAKIGLFVLIGLAAMVYFILRTDEVQGLWPTQADATREIHVELTDASGVREGTPVRVAGVRVGEVRRLSLEDGIAVAIIEVPQDMVFREGAVAELRNQGVLGERYISLVSGRGEPLANQDRLQGSAPPSLEDLTTTINQLGENLLIISENLKQSTTTDSGGNRIALIAQNIERLTDTLVQMVEENRGSLSTTSAELAGLSQQLNRDVPQLVSELTELVRGLRSMTTGNENNIDQTMENVAVISKNMNATTESLASIARKVDGGQGTLGKLVNESESVDKLNDLLDKANESLTEVKKFVDRASNIDLDLQFKTEYLSEWQTNKTYFGVRIRPDDTKYYLIEGISREVDQLPTEIRTVTEETFDAQGNLLTTTVRTRTEEPDDLVFNGILAYRFGNLFLKGGVMESEGGGGIEYRALEDRLRFSIDAFDFSRPNDLAAHGKVDLEFQWRHGIHFSVGWDEFLEADLQSAYIGGGIRWSDEDLKLLLSNVGSLF